MVQALRHRPEVDESDTASSRSYIRRSWMHGVDDVTDGRVCGDYDFFF